MTNQLTTEQIAVLVKRIGNHDVVARIANCDPSLIERWAHGEALPTPAQMEGLIFVHERSADIPNDQVFRLFLDAPVSLPNRPGTIPAARAIGLGVTEEVRAKARHIRATSF